MQQVSRSNYDVIGFLILYDYDTGRRTMTKKRNKALLMTAKEFIEKVQSLLSDDGASQGVSLKESVELALKNPLPNFWNIIEYGEGNPGKYGRSAHETRYSRMLRWLLDPKENHNCGNYLARKLFEIKNERLPEEEKILARDLDRFFPEGEKGWIPVAVEPEWERFDVSYKDSDHKLFIGIEVKQYASEQLTGDGDAKKSQLTRYNDSFEKWKKDHCGGEDPQKVLIFLTPLKVEPTDKEWIAMSYEELIEILRPMVSMNPELNFVKVLLDFIHDLERVIVQKRYDENKDALRAIVNDEHFLNALIFYSSAIEPEEAKESGASKKQKEQDKNELAREEFYKEIRVGNYDEQRIITAMGIMFNSRTIQDHTPSDAVQRVIRRLFQVLTDSETPPTIRESNLTKELSQNLRDSTIFRSVKLTRGKGQGIHFYTDYKDYNAYISGGNKKGEARIPIPNDQFIMRIPKDAPKGTPLKRFESGIRNGKYDAKELNKNEESLNQFIKEVIQGLKKISDDFQREVADENNEEFRKALAEIKID